jgi:predicted Zn-ribbon and HTH transcriptional regulator
MDAIVFGEVSLQQLLIWVGAGVGALVILGVLRKMFSRKQPMAQMQTVSCTNCNWRGRASRFAGRCPKCNEPIGERLSGRRD